jgi:hypothetical protein
MLHAHRDPTGQRCPTRIVTPSRLNATGSRPGRTIEARPEPGHPTERAHPNVSGFRPKRCCRWSSG